MNFFVVFIVLAIFASLSNGRPSSTCTRITEINNNAGRKSRTRSSSEDWNLRATMVRTGIGILFGLNSSSYLPFDSIDEDTEMDIDMEMGMARSPIFETFAEDISEGTNNNSTNNTTEYEQIVSLFIQDEININETNDIESVLLSAAAVGDEKLARLLIHNGANFTVKNKHGKSASEIATDNGFTELGRVLQENIAQKACDVYSNLQVEKSKIWDGAFPWMAALGYFDRNLKVRFICDGTLISEKFVLTTSQCVQDDSRPVIVRLGQVYLNETHDMTIIKYHQIRNIISHPGYSYSKRINDIALIELVKSVSFTEFIRPACLQTYLRDESPNVELTIAKWGFISTEWYNRSIALIKANFSTLSWSKCNSTVFKHTQSGLYGAAFQNGIGQSHYCATHPNGVNGTCEKDHYQSGGPLQIVRPNFNTSTVLGIVSTQISCGTSFLGIYTRVAYFIDWIESHVWPNGEISTPILNTEQPFWWVPASVENLTYTTPIIASLL